MQRADPSHFKSISFEIGQFANESRAEEDEGFCQRPPSPPKKCAALNAVSLSTVPGKPGFGTPGFFKGYRGDAKEDPGPASQARSE